MTGRMTQRSPLFCNLQVIELLFGGEDVLFGWFEYRVHAPDDTHGQNDVWVFATLEQIAQDVICNTPYKRDDFVVGDLFHDVLKSIKNMFLLYATVVCYVIKLRINTPTIHHTSPIPCYNRLIHSVFIVHRCTPVSNGGSHANTGTS